jgi:hypothetical protein
VSAATLRQRRSTTWRYAEHEAAFKSARAALEHAINCGRLLLEAKAKPPHGTWPKLINPHYPFVVMDISRDICVI